MEQQSNNSNNSRSRRRLDGFKDLYICIGIFIIIFLSSSSTIKSVEGYKNYTVGDTLGWYDNLENPKVDYQKWVSDKTFSLGDFLLFNTDNNHSIVQTYNFTTYTHCDYNNALDNDTVQWAASDPSAISPHGVFVAIPLLKTGLAYFFSSDYDGEQCQNGQRFKINVTYGQGLPPSLKNDDGSLAPASGPIAGNNDDESAPETLVPSNFDHPQEDTSENDSEPSQAISLSLFLKLSGKQLNILLIFLSLICTAW